MKDFIKQQATLKKRHNEAWDLMNRYYEKYQTTKHPTDLEFSRTYLKVGLALMEHITL